MGKRLLQVRPLPIDTFHLSKFKGPQMRQWKRRCPTVAARLRLLHGRPGDNRGGEVPDAEHPVLSLGVEPGDQR